MQTVNNIQKQIEGLEAEITKQQSKARRRRAEIVQTEPNDSSSHINLKSLLKGIDGSRNMKNIVILFEFQEKYLFDYKDSKK